MNESTVNIDKLPLPPGVTLTFHVHASDEDVPLEGHFVGAGAPEDREENAEMERELMARLDQGDTWAWCQVTVVARLTCGDFSLMGEEHLGACSYREEAEFRADGYFSDMKREAFEKLKKELEETARVGQLAQSALDLWK